MASRGAAAVLNAVLWGSGYIYSGKGASAILLVLAHLILYAWALDLGLTGWLFVMGPIFLLGSIYFARDGYRFVSQSSTGSRVRIETESKTKVENKKGVCPSCGAAVSAKAKFCPECGASQSEQGSA